MYVQYNIYKTYQVENSEEHLIMCKNRVLAV